MQKIKRNAKTEWLEQLTSSPIYLTQALELAGQLTAYAPWELETILRTGPEIAARAFDYYQDFSNQDQLSPALLSFQGLAFKYIAAEDFTAADFAYAQDHLRILNALYGILKPMDGIQPHRLDFMGRFRFEKQTLYTYWGKSVYNQLFQNGDTVLNLCSEEYGKLVRPHMQPQDYMVSCRFLTKRRNKLVCLATEAKMARGQMVRYIIKNRVDDPQKLKKFCSGDYLYSRQHSSPNEMVFLSLQS